MSPDEVPQGSFLGALDEDSLRPDRTFFLTPFPRYNGCKNRIRFNVDDESCCGFCKRLFPGALVYTRITFDASTGNVVVGRASGAEKGNPFGKES